MRQYGEEQLKADKLTWQEAKNRHAEYFAGFVNNQSLRLQSPAQVAGVKALAEEIDGNIKNAWDWLVSEQRWHDLIQSMVMGLFQYSIICTYDELIPWVKSARISSATDDTPEGRRAYAIFSSQEVYGGSTPDVILLERLRSTWQMVNQLDLAEVMGFWFVPLSLLALSYNLISDIDEQLEATINRLREQKSQYQLGMSLYFLAHRMSDFVYDEASLFEAAKIFKSMGVIYEQGMVAELMANHAYRQRRALAEVSNYFHQASQFYRKLKGYTTATGIIFAGLPEIYFRQGKYEQGFAIYEQEKQELERLGLMRQLAYIEHWECLHAARYSTNEYALSLRQHSFELAKKFGVQSDLAWSFFELGDVYRIIGEPEKALDFYEQAQPMFEEMNMVLGLSYDQRARGDLDLAEKRYPDALVHYQKFDAYAREINHIWSMAQSRARIALAYAYLGNIEQAHLDMKSALTQTYFIREDALALQTLLSEGVCLVKEGNLDEAIELMSFLQHHPASWNEVRQHARSIQEMASGRLPEEAVQAAVERGKALDLDKVVAELINRPPSS